jgi:hypothetical protein
MELPGREEGGQRMTRMEAISERIESKNNGLVLEVFDMLINNRHCAAAGLFWSPNYTFGSDLSGRLTNLASELCC